MTSLRSVIEKVFENTNNLVKLLVGGLLSFVPIVNFFAFGYLYRLGRETAQTGSVSLPVWDDWGRLFLDGLKFLAVFLIYGVIPLLIGLVLSLLLDLMTGHILGCIPYFPLTFTFLLAPFSFASALYTLNKGIPLERIHEDFRAQWARVKSNWQRLVVPVLALLGLHLVGLSLYGFSFFIAFSVFIPYSCLVFRDAEKN